MGDASRWAPLPWRHADERHFQAALALSVVLHAVLMFGWKLQRTDWRAAGQSVFTVSFRVAALPPSPPAAAAEAGGGKREVPTVLVQPQSSHSVAAPAAGQTAAGNVTPARSARPATAPSAAPQPLRPGQPVAGPVTRAAPPAGGVNVMFTLGDNGRVNEIYWNELPALTDRQLQRLETTIRQRRYPPGMGRRTVTENVDVRAFLTNPGSVDAPTPSPEPAQE
jgi:hypothetical protein